MKKNPGINCLLLVIAIGLFGAETAPPAAAQISQISPQAVVGTQDGVLVSEFVIPGATARDILVRGRGPSLSNTNKLADPFMELRDQNGVVLEFNDDWQQAARSAEIQNSGMAPSDPKESAILRLLSPGMYSVVVRGIKDSNGMDTIGSATNDVIDYANSSVLTALGARGKVGTGGDVLIMPLTLAGSSSQNILGRLLGPSLVASVPGALLDPTFELRDSNGGLLIFDDDWMDDANQKTLIQNSGLAPSDNKEAAFVKTVAPGNYIAIGRGVNNSTGIGFAQLYVLPYSGAQLNPAPTVSPSSQPTPTPNPTPTPSTPTPTPNPTATPTATPSATPTPTPMPTPTATPTATPIASPTPTATPFNPPPTIQLTTANQGGTTPANGSRLAANETFTLSAIAVDNGSLAGVEFLIDDSPIARVAAPPYRFATSLASAGDHILMARAIDNQGATTDSNTITITILPANGIAYRRRDHTASRTWSDANNWSPAGVPGPNDLAEVTNGQTVSIADAPVTVGSLTLSGGSSLTGPHTLIVNDNLYLSSGNVSGLQTQITAQGQFVIPRDGTVQFNNVVINNHGTAKWAKKQPNTTVADANTIFDNSGTFVIRSEPTDVPPNVELAHVTNSGLVKIQGRVLWGTFTQSAGQLDLSDRYCIDCAHTQAVLSVVDRVQLNGGMLTGMGTIIGTLENLSGSLLPGNSPGKITVQGNYTQGAKGLLGIEIGGAKDGQFDQLIVTGKAQLGGRLSVRTINHFTPNSSTQFAPLQFSSFSGSFASVSSNAQVSLSSTGANVNVTGPNPPAPQAQNLSTRLNILSGENVLISGFIITGPSGSTKTVALRGIGPSLAFNDMPLAGRLADPLLELHNKSGATIATNDNWREASNANEVPVSIKPSDDRESVLLKHLSPGLYSAILKGAAGTTGIGLAELYDLDQPSATELANISTRGLVQTGDDVLIGGFIIGGKDPAKVLVRAIGPSLAAAGIAGSLADPTLELHDGNGNTMSNDDWRNTQEAEITATTIPPSKNRESAILATLSPGLYTAVVRGKNNTTGVALVEVYMLQ